MRWDATVLRKQAGKKSTMMEEKINKAKDPGTHTHTLIRGVCFTQYNYSMQHPAQKPNANTQYETHMNTRPTRKQMERITLLRFCSFELRGVCVRALVCVRVCECVMHARGVQ